MTKSAIFTLMLAFGAFIGAGSASAQSVAERCDLSESFAPDADVQRMNEAYALDAVDAARANFGVELDWSDESIGAVEQMLAQLHDQIDAAPSEDAIWTLAKMFGSYTGEVFRRNHGGQWGLVTLNGERFPGMQANQTCRLFWPWGKAHNRIVNGPEDNILHYYQSLLRSESE